jgi:hypothetical protein
MITKVKRLLHLVFSTAASRFAEKTPVEPGPPPTSPPQGQFALPPFQGSAEEAAIHLRSPAVIKVTTRVLVRPDKSGVMPKTVEEILLTQQGKAIARTEFVLMDGLNIIGRPDEVPRLCGACERFTFQGQACSGCWVFLCPACAQPLDETPNSPVFCPTCHRTAIWNRDNWAKDMASHPQTNLDETQIPNRLDRRA